MEFFAITCSLIMQHHQLIFESNYQPMRATHHQILAQNESSRSQAVFPQLIDLSERAGNASYPRIGQSWAAVENVGEESPETSTARHDLYFAGVQSFGLQWKKNIDGGESSEFQTTSIPKAQEKRARLLAKNPHMVILSEIRYYDALPDTYPKGSAYWQHSDVGECVVNTQFSLYNRLNFENLDLQDHVASQARAALASGVVDGVMLDWWDGHNEIEQQAKLQLLQKVRVAVGPDAVIIINTNENAMPIETTKLVNGYFMENYKTGTMATEDEITREWQQIKNTLSYSVENARSPNINLAEVWWDRHGELKRNQLPRMRAITTLVMTQSDGYALFADPNQNGVTNGHEHNWYQFWDADVGKPLRKGQTQADGTCIRNFENGQVVSNATNSVPATLKFPQPMRRCSDNGSIRVGEETIIAAHDGDIFLFETK